MSRHEWSSQRRQPRAHRKAAATGAECLLRTWIAPRANLALLQLQLALIFFNKSLKIGSSIEQPGPLFVVERHRKAAQPVHADAALFTDAELQGAASLFPFHLLFQIGKASFQFFVTWFGHGCTSNVFECLFYYRAASVG